MRASIALVALVCLGVAAAPVTVAETPEPEDGKCVWTSTHGGKVEAGWDMNSCTGSGGEWQEE